MDCDEPVDLKGNKTAKDELGFGCLKVYTDQVFIFIGIVPHCDSSNRWEAKGMKMSKRPK
jgi:hypothetical protein